MHSMKRFQIARHAVRIYHDSRQDLFRIDEHEPPIVKVQTTRGI